MESMINLFNRHKGAGTCGFDSWCDFVDWLHREKPDKSKLGELKELSAKAYASVHHKAEKVIKPVIQAAHEVVQPEETSIQEEVPVQEEASIQEEVPVQEEASKPKKRKPKAGE